MPLNDQGVLDIFPISKHGRHMKNGIEHALAFFVVVFFLCVCVCFFL